MKTLIVYYSRTGTTRKIAENISKALNADIEEIIDLKNRKGIIGYIMAGRDAMKNRLTRIKPIDKKPSKYDLIIIGSPVWAWSLSAPVRTYVHQNKPYMKGKKFAYFCTMGGSGFEKLFAQLEELTGQRSIATLTLTTKEVVKNQYKEKVKDFVEKIK